MNPTVTMTDSFFTKFQLQNSKREEFAKIRIRQYLKATPTLRKSAGLLDLYVKDLVDLDEPDARHDHVPVRVGQGRVQGPVPLAVGGRLLTLVPQGGPGAHSIL